jgi:hypothetical protein
MKLVFFLCHHSLKPNRHNQCQTKDVCTPDLHTVFVHSTNNTLQNLQYHGHKKHPVIANFGVLNMKMTLKN